MLSYSSILSGVQPGSGAAASGPGSGEGSEQDGSSIGRRSTPTSINNIGRSRSRSPSSTSSPRLGRIGVAGAASPLPTIPSASNLEAVTTSSSSPRSFTLTGSHFEAGFNKGRSSSLAPGGVPMSASASSSTRVLPDPIGSGSPREQRLYDRGAATPQTAASNVFSSSFPSSNSNLWLAEPPATTIPQTQLHLPPQQQQQQQQLPASQSASGQGRTTISRHMSLSGSVPRIAASSTHGTPFGNDSARTGLSWPDSPLSISDAPLTSIGSTAADAREGRSRTRLGASIGPVSGSYQARSGVSAHSGGSNGNGSNAGILKPGSGYTVGEGLHRSLSITSGERTRYGGDNGGIDISNMSPFVRDVEALREPQSSTLSPPHAGANAGHPYSASFSTSSDFFPRERRAAAGAARQNGPLTAGLQQQQQQQQSQGSSPRGPGASIFGGFGSSGMRDFSLGAVGSGRSPFLSGMMPLSALAPRRRESFWGTTERPLREGDEDEYADSDGDDEEDDHAPPTRSGATSRRHSVAAFTASSSLTSPPFRSQIGFNLPSDSQSSAQHGAGHSRSAGLTFGSQPPSASAAHQSFFSGADESSSRLDDEDLLATDLTNALQLNLEAQAARQQYQQQAPETAYHVHLRQNDSGAHASSLPTQTTLQQPMPGTTTASHSYAPGTSPSAFGNSRAGAGGNASTSPSRGPGPRNLAAHDRRSSTSGDPYSPSASAARYLATAHHVQPPPLQPGSGLPTPGRSAHAALPQQQQHSPAAQKEQVGSGSTNLPTTLWPPPGANVFSQTSPNFRPGTLPPPESLTQYSGDGQRPRYTPSPDHLQYQQEQQRYANQHHYRPQSDSPASAYGGQQQQQEGRGGPPSNTAPLPQAQYAQPQHGMAPPPSMYARPTGYPGPPPRMPSGGSMPPFAGFGARQPSMSGPPPPMLSPLNAHAQPYYVAPIAPQPSLNDLGRGVPLHALPSGGPLYIVEFKAGRTDLFYVDDPEHLVLAKGDLVVVEADRGKDLGKCLTSCTLDEVRDFQMYQVESALGQLAAGAGGGATIGGVGTLPPGQQPSAATIARMTKEIHPKKIYGRASPADVALLAIKAQDEAKALNICRAKVLQHQLPMEVTDAEFQFDRRRLTFFYVADRRIDFRSLVKDLFRLYKTRIWLVDQAGF